MLGTGSPAPDVDLHDLDGERFQLTEALRRGSVLLAFFKISCPTCQLTFPFLQRLADAGATDITLVAISQDDVEDSREFQQRFGVSMRTLVDAKPAYYVSNAYRIDSVPSFFLIDPNGKITRSFDGFRKAELEQFGPLFGVETFRPDEKVPAIRPG